MDPAAVARVLEVADRAREADGADPLDEATRRALAHHPDRLRLAARDDGFALLDGQELSLVVHPHARGDGLGADLLAAVLVEHDRPGLRAWSHSDHPAAARLASAFGFDRVRELWMMRRPTSRPLPDPLPHPGVRVRSFRDDDADAVVRLNAESFAEHPEQAGMDAADFAERRAEPWFDPAGLLVAEDESGRLIGFHWTKQHSPTTGEVYVVAVDPRVQGMGLGRLVTLAGLEHLAGLGVEEVVLYVESDNAPAIRVYRDKLGFTHAPRDTHVQYVRHR